MKYFLGLVLSLSVASFAFGDSWAEVGDAGDQLFSGFQDTVGMPGATLDSITGATNTDVGDAHDAYRITIESADWSIQAAGFDTRLWLFDTAGNLLMSNDDGFDNDGNALPGFRCQPVVDCQLGRWHQWRTD